MSDCMLCPRRCGINRDMQTGVCGVGSAFRLARAALHFYEEPCISGTEGSGAVFFSGCSLRCIYCQNRNIALARAGEEVSPGRLFDIFFELKEQGACNINLVTPTHYADALIPVLKRAKDAGLGLPFVYNTSGYERVEVIRSLEGLVDVWLPDLKYMDPVLAGKYSNAPDYPVVAKAALAEMVRQAGEPVFDANGLMKKGVIVRQLVLPGHTKNSKQAVEYLYGTYGDRIYISIMNQYTPLITGEDAERFPELTRRVTKREYDNVVDHAIRLGVENAYIQEGKTAEESYIPEFDGTGVRQRSS